MPWQGFRISSLAVRQKFSGRARAVSKGVVFPTEPLTFVLILPFENAILECRMTYIVTDNCIRCKYTDCVEVCPVDCFYEGENFLVIHPDECIDCGVCEPECPAEAIKPDTEPGLDKWLKINADYAKIWPNITVKKEPMPEAKEMDGVDGKFEQFFSENPGSGD